MPVFKMRFLVFAVLPLALAGCISDQEQLALDQDKCSSYGYRPGTDRFADCVRMQDQQRAAEEQRFRERTRAREQEERERKAVRRREDDIDTRPSYDKDGNPNFDTDGDYIGCHGIGCMVDNPDAG